MRTTCHCGQGWTGAKLEHCVACHRTFSNTTNGDRHRTGQHHLSTGPDRRRCRTEDELLEVGLHPTVTSNGSIVWRRTADTPRFPVSGDDQETPNGVGVG